MSVTLEKRGVFGWGSSGAGWAHPTLGVVVHYDGSDLGLADRPHSACRAYWRRTRRFHMGSGRGWADIGYSFGCCPHGIILEGRGLNRSQAAQPGGNTTWYSITFMCGPTEHPTPAQLRAFREWRAWLMRDHGVGRGVRYHGQFIATSCAGPILNPMVRSGAIASGETSGAAPAPAGGVLREGSTGSAVLAAQAQLAYLGYNLGSYGADGRFGRRTTAAVHAFQRDHGLAEDGIIGRNTRAALAAAVEEGRRDVPSSAEYYKDHAPEGEDAQVLEPGQWTLIRWDSIKTRQKSEEGAYYSVAFGECEYSVTAALTLMGARGEDAEVGLSPGAEYQMRCVEVAHDGEGWQVVRRMPVDPRYHVGGDAHMVLSWGFHLPEDHRIRVEAVQYGQLPTPITGGRLGRKQWEVE